MTQPTKGHTGSAAMRALQRPDAIKAPAHWQASAPPQPLAPVIDADEAQPGRRNPVRYGDWEYKGLAIDF